MHYGTNRYREHFIVLLFAIIKNNIFIYVRTFSLLSQNLNIPFYRVRRAVSDSVIRRAVLEKTRISR
jgi:hypothetical protein